MISSSESRSVCHTSRPRKPSASSTRCARARNAWTSSPARSGRTRRRERETYIAPVSSRGGGDAGCRADRVAAEEGSTEAAREPRGRTGSADRERELARKLAPPAEVGEEACGRDSAEYHDLRSNDAGGTRHVCNGQIGSEVLDAPAVIAVERQAEAQEADVVLLARRAREQRHATVPALPPVRGTKQTPANCVAREVLLGDRDLVPLPARPEVAEV